MGRAKRQTQTKTNITFKKVADIEKLPNKLVSKFKLLWQMMYELTFCMLV